MTVPVISAVVLTEKSTMAFRVGTDGPVETA